MGTVSAKGTILYFAHCNNYHTIKWASHFASAGYRVHVASLERCVNDEITAHPNVEVHWLRNSGKRMGSAVQKLRYLTAVSAAHKLVKEIDPDIVHAHFASSYGLVCALACRRPFYLSVWGADVYDFPRKSPLHRAVLKYSLRRCSWLLSTSEVMAEETHRYTDKSIEITPFGVDMSLFSPSLRDREQDGRFVIGTVKALERKYGIHVLLCAAAGLRARRPDLDVRLRIAGKGTMEGGLRTLAKDLGIADAVTWLGFIPQSDAAREWANFDVGVVASASESESFGVSAVECQACGTPLVITDIPGLMEACNGGRTAVIVPRCDSTALAAAIEALADDPAKRTAMGARGREYVEGAYEIEACFRRVEEMYERNGGGPR